MKNTWDLMKEVAKDEVRKRGDYTELAELKKVERDANKRMGYKSKLDRLIEKLSKQDIYFDDVQYSPFHPNAKIKKYKKNSPTRKPGNKLIENIKLNWDIDLKKSFMIGDKETDKLSAYKSKLYFQYAQFDLYFR